jgi:hypothetical protein
VCPYGRRRALHQGSKGRWEAMRALSYRPFCSCDGRRVSLGDLSAAHRYTTRSGVGGRRARRRASSSPAASTGRGWTRTAPSTPPKPAATIASRSSSASEWSGGRRRPRPPRVLPLPCFRRPSCLQTGSAPHPHRTPLLCQAALQAREGFRRPLWRAIPRRDAGVRKQPYPFVWCFGASHPLISCILAHIWPTSLSERALSSSVLSVERVLVS